MIVLVTGATGAAGRAVCALLHGRGETVLAVGSDAGRLASVEASERLVVELTDPDAVRALVEGLGPIDAVLHLVGGWRGGDTPEADAWLRPRLVDTLANVIRAVGPSLRERRGRLAMVSSTAVGPRPTSSYTRAKADAEELVAHLAAALGPVGGAATVFAIRSLGEEGTPPAALAERLAAWLTEPAAATNGGRLTP